MLEITIVVMFYSRTYSKKYQYLELHTIRKKRSERRKHCALAVVRRRQKFCSTADPLPEGAGRPKFNQLEIISTFTYKPSLVRIDARNLELLW